MENELYNINNTIQSLCCLSIIYCFFQTGDFYYYNKLEEPYRSIYVIKNITISDWLLINGINGICTSIYFSAYHISNYYHINVINLSRSETFCFLFGFTWTIVGSVFLFIDKIFYDKDVFKLFLWLKIGLQFGIYFIAAVIRY